MTLAVIQPGGFAFGERLPSSWANAIDANQSNAVDGVGGGTYAPSSAIIIGGAGLQIGTLTVSGNSTIGSDGSDTLTVNAESNFVGDMAADVVVIADLTAAALLVSGNCHIGNSDADTCTVTAVLLINDDCTIGTSPSDTLTINATTTFTGSLIFNDAEFSGTVLFADDVQLGTGSGDDIQIYGVMTLRNRLLFADDGRVPLRAGTLAADADETITVEDGNSFKIPTGTSTTRTVTISSTGAVDGDFMHFWTGGHASGAPAEIYNINSAEDFAFPAGVYRNWVTYEFLSGSWRIARSTLATVGP